MKIFIEKYYRYFLPIGLALEILILLLSFIEAGRDWHMYFRVEARLSGRISLLFFSIFFIYATLHPSVQKDSDGLLVKFVLAKNLAILHVIHWCLLITARLINGFPLKFYNFFGILGTIAYLMIILMPFFLKGSIFKSLKPSLIQNVYVYYVWTIFFSTYLARIFGITRIATGTMQVYVTLMVFVVGLLIWRFVFLWHARKFRSLTNRE